MLNFAINTYVHILSVIIVIVCLVKERMMIKPDMEWKNILRILKTDGVYGAAAILVVITGLLNWMNFGKGYEYYANNSIFILKFSLFIVVGLLSIYPTVWFSRYKKRYRSNPPDFVRIENAHSIKSIITVELAIMAIMPLLATLMANGIGF